MLCWNESSAVLGPAALEISNTTKPRICKLFRLSYTKPLQKGKKKKKACFHNLIILKWKERLRSQAAIISSSFQYSRLHGNKLQLSVMILCHPLPDMYNEILLLQRKASTED